MEEAPLVPIPRVTRKRSRMMKAQLLFILKITIITFQPTVYKYNQFLLYEITVVQFKIYLNYCSAVKFTFLQSNFVMQLTEINGDLMECSKCTHLQIELPSSLRCQGELRR